tara:strand:- start:10895 stop:11359 length:465 start_codon:yes stop_codon:yes gene_type:complete
MIVMGIDLALVNTGICVLNNGVKYNGTFITSKEDEDIIRSIQIANNIISLIKKYNVEFVGIENYPYHSYPFGNYSYRIGETVGVVKYLLNQNDIEWRMVAIRAHKKLFTGNGGAKKEDMMERVIKLYGIMMNQHEADACSIAYYITQKQKISEE